MCIKMNISGSIPGTISRKLYLSDYGYTHIAESLSSPLS